MPFIPNLLGAVNFGLSRFEQALASCSKALQINPNYAEAHYDLGNVLQQMGKQDEAVASFHNALRIKPNYAEAHYNLGNALMQSGKLDKAVASYRKALQIDPDYVHCFTNLCELYEKSNNLEALSYILSDKAAHSFREEDNVRYYRAVFAFRSEDYSSCIKIIESIDPEKIVQTQLILFLRMKAQILDTVGRVDEAFSVFSEMNHEALQSKLYKTLNPDQYINQNKLFLNELKSIQTPYHEDIYATEAISQPYFLVGFPRSGTTLLDTILRTHSKVEVIEEKQMIVKVVSGLRNTKTLSLIENLNCRDIEKLRAIYENELKLHKYSDTAQITIEKLPLNALDTPLISRLYPKSKFILAVRHPLDCVLSCFMQPFRINNAMANMAKLDRIVEFYCLTMEMFFFSDQRYDINYEIVRYEDLVADMKKEVTSLLSFLNLDWEDSLLNYQETAKKRSVIYTPSYSQVIQPIYKDATYRWKKYEQHLSPYILQLTPWIEKFGYEI